MAVFLWWSGKSSRHGVRRADSGSHSASTWLYNLVQVTAPNVWCLKRGVWTGRRSSPGARPQSSPQQQTLNSPLFLLVSWLFAAAFCKRFLGLFTVETARSLLDKRSLSRFLVFFSPCKFAHLFSFFGQTGSSWAVRTCTFICLAVACQVAGF